MSPPSGTTTMARYAATLPPSGQRSGDAHARSHLHRCAGALARRMERAMGEAHIAGEALGAAPERIEGSQARKEGAVLAVLAERAGVLAARALADALAQAGALGCAEEAAEEAWTTQATADARAWLERRAAPTRWDALARAIGKARAGGAIGAVGVGALATIAGGHPEIVHRLGTVDPWVAREACRTMEIGALGEPAGRWPVRIVQRQARRMGASAVGDAEARAALADWRWPRAHPPLAVLAAGAMTLPPIEGDSAWAHALAKRWTEVAARHRRGEGDEGGSAERARAASRWAERERAGEGKAIEDARERVRALARGGRRTRGSPARERWRPRRSASSKPRTSRA